MHFMEKPPEKAALNKETLNELRSSHYALGKYPKQMQTMNQRNYYPKSEEMKHNLPDTGFINLMKGHHFNMGTAIPPYVSVNGMTYTAHEVLKYSCN
jgi:hypothetical protein